jgi:N-succinyldiaminopimelate aminotransferase
MMADYGHGVGEPLVQRMRGFGTTVFAEMSALALATGSVNLGQGFPDSDGPQAMLEEHARGLRSGLNQYPPGPGVPALREAVARHQHEHYGLGLDPATQVLVTVGATEAIAASVLALVEPGDEVVLVEPYYDSYAASVALAGATRRTVPLRRHDGRFGIDVDELHSAVGPRTRLLLLNTPHNPTGTVLTRDELEGIAQVCRENDLLVVSDEVYEHLTFDGLAHVPIATLPGMFERTVTVSSAGKSFSCTGWKTGWVSGPPELVRAVQTVKQFLTFTAHGAAQTAVAHALDNEMAWVEELAASLQAKRDLLTAGLRAAGLAPLRSEGTYFVQADVAALGWGSGQAFARALPERAGVVCIPTEVFCDTDAGRTLVRFAFCKQDGVLEEAARRLASADLRAPG